MATAIEMATRHGVSVTCSALGLPRATYYRQRAPVQGPRVRRPSPPRALSEAEREAVLDALHEP